MRTKGPLFAAVGMLALGASADLSAAQDFLEDQFRCEDYLATGDIASLAAIAADDANPLHDYAAECLARFVQPAQGRPLDLDDSNNPDGIYPG